MSALRGALTTASLLLERLGVPGLWARRTLRSIGFGTVGALLGIVFALVAPKHYKTVTVLAVDAPTDLGNVGSLAGIAAQLGVQTASGSSPFYYAAFGDNTDVLSRVLYERFEDTPGDSTLLIDLYRPGTWSNGALRVQRAINDLRSDLDLSTDIKSGLLTLEVTQPEPRLARVVAESIVAAVDLIGRQRLRSRASAEREFAETSLREAEGRLRAAEDSLQRFYQANRNIESSPSLKLQEARILRQVTLRQDLVGTLQHQLEDARLSEVRHTPLLTVVQHPLLPGKPSWPKKSVMAIVGFALGVMLAFLPPLRPNVLRTT